MKTTSEILKALAPEFVALDELCDKRKKSPGLTAREDHMSEPCTIKWGKREGWVSSWEGYEVVESMCDGAGYKDPEPVTHWLPMPLPPQESDA